METLTYAGTLVVRKCWCGMRHAIPEELSRQVDLDETITVYCPVGHEWVSGSHEQRQTDKLRAERDQAYRRAQATRDLLKHEERSHAATKGHLTRQKRRATAGVCPVQGCQRHFRDLERHMGFKHPDYTESHDAMT